MERKQVNLLFKVLKIFQQQGVLNHVIIIGSWCIYFYKFYFKRKTPIIVSLRTRDVDFFIPKPTSINKKIDLPDILKHLGFIVDFRGEKGYMRLVHPAFFIEFLVPERGRPIDKPYSLPFGVNAQRLRFLDMLSLKTIQIKVKDIKLTLPHPSCFLLHKIIIFKRRKQEKQSKEMEQIRRLIRFLEEVKQMDSLKEIYFKIHPKWRKRIINNLKTLKEEKIIEILSAKI